MSGHKYGVYATALNESNKTLYSGSADNTIGVWTCKSRKLERSLEGHGGTVTAISLSKNEKFLFSLGSDNLLIVWSMGKFKMINKFDLFSSSNYSRSFALSDQYYTIFGRDKKNPCKLRILNLMSGETVKMLKVHKKPIRTIAIAPDDDHFYTGGGDCVVNVFKTENADLVHSICSHTAPVNDMTVSKDSKSLATASNDKTVRIFNCEQNYELLHVFKHAVEVSELQFSRSHQKLITGGWHFRPIKVWNTAFLNIKFDPNALNTPGIFFMSKSPINQKKTPEPSTGDRMKQKVLNYAQKLQNVDDIELARQSLDTLGKKGPGVTSDAQDNIDENFKKLIKQTTTGSIEEVPEDEDDNLTDSKLEQVNMGKGESINLGKGPKKNLARNYAK